MHGNVFGEPITEATLMEMPQYTGRMVTRRNLAQVALDRKNFAGKDAEAVKCAEELKNKWGRGTATMCLLYNATGGTITLSDHHDWYGHVASTPYPAELANGQWGVFLHVRPTLLAQGSVGAVMYRGRNSDESICYWIMAWNNPWNRLSDDNQVAARTRDESRRFYWPPMENFFINPETGKPSGLNAIYSDKGCKSSVGTGSDKRPFVKAIFTLDDSTPSTGCAHSAV